MVQRLGIPLEPWRPVDSLAVLKLYAWGLSGSVDASLVLSDLVKTLGGFESRRFFPREPAGDGVPMPARNAVTASRFRDPLRAAVGLHGHHVGSSAWVLGGAHTESGRPVVVADAHLEPTAPPLFHLDHVRGGDLDVAGATIPGLPVVWTGHNQRVAWASTHAQAAVLDLFHETLHPSDPDLYHDGRGWKRLERRSETIVVRGADDVQIEVRATRHGPLIHELLEPPRDPLAISWVGSRVSEGSTFASLLRASLARDARSLRAALAELREPPLAIVYADSEGAAGMQVVGWVPRRSLATGLVPLPGRARWYDWEGRIPFAGLPSARLRDDRGWVIAADNPFASGEDRAEWLWRSGVRGRRIDGRLRSTVGERGLSLRRLASLQTDVGEGRGTALVAMTLKLAEGEPRIGREAREVADLLRAWDGRATPTSAGAAAYHTFLVALTEALFEGALGEDLFQRYLELPQADPGQVVFGIVRDASDPDKVREAVRGSLSEAWFGLSYQLGRNRGKWHWGRLHPLRFRRFGPADRIDAFGELGPFGAGGSNSTVNTAEYDPARPYDVRVASTYRFAADTGALNESLVSLAPGQSEHPRNPHFSDGVGSWLAGRFHLLATGRVFVEESSVARLVLNPAP
jgi:penicillin amidase